MWSVGQKQQKKITYHIILSQEQERFNLDLVYLIASRLQFIVGKIIVKLLISSVSFSMGPNVLKTTN